MNLIVTSSPRAPIFTVSLMTGSRKFVVVLPALRTTQKVCLRPPISDMSTHKEGGNLRRVDGEDAHHR